MNKPKVELGKIYTINKWKKRKIQEDNLLNEKVLRMISNYYGSIYKIIKHTRVNKKEIDAIIYCRTTKYKIPRFIGTKLIGIELKEYNLKRVVEQAIERREFFDYFYIVTGGYGSHYRYLGWDIKMLYEQGLLGKMLKMGIGWILAIGEPVLIFPSIFKRTKYSTNWEKWLKKS